MTKIARSTRRRPDPEDQDPYRYGWRYVRQLGPDGKETFEQVPLTLEDVLHPEEEDFIVQSNAHDQDRIYLKNVFQSRLARRRGALVLADCRIAWDKPGLKAHGPDITVIFGVRRPKRDWSTFDVAQEGVRPVLIIEITSRTTRRNDLGIKVQHYHRAEVPLYIIVDARTLRGKRTLQLIGYRWTPQRYESLPLDERGRLLLEPLGLRLGVKGDRVVLYDAATDEELANYETVVKNLEAATAARRSAEAEIAELQARLQQAEEQLRRKRKP
jgi:colicin import membrane protein